MGFFSLITMTIMTITNAINTYNLDTLTNGVWLSGAAYCGKENYNSMKLSPPVSDFVYMGTLYDIKTDLQGYIGLLPSQNTINVVLRGSSSFMNWLDDFEIRLVPYDTFPECNCKVHNGFYRSALGVRNQTLDTIKLLYKVYPYYQIIVTGHSYGASVGQLLAMELQRENLDVQIYNYGQPRVGDDKYAAFVNKNIDVYWRTVHDRDMVPHMPPTMFNYVHSCREIFEDSNGVLNVCNHTDCEDPLCANQYNLMETNTNDHLYYLGHRVACEESVSNYDSLVPVRI